MSTCEICNNELVGVPVKERVYKGMGVWRNKTKYVKTCTYCAWKGNIGPGAQLRSMIKMHNEAQL